MPPTELDGTQSLAKRVGAIKVLVLAAAALLASGAGVMTYLGRYARASELSEHIEQSDKTHEAIQKRLADHDIGMAVMHEALNRIEEDLHWQRDQAAATARAVGAPVVPPKH